GGRAGGGGVGLGELGAEGGGAGHDPPAGLLVAPVGCAPAVVAEVRGGGVRPPGATGRAGAAARRQRILITIPQGDRHATKQVVPRAGGDGPAGGRRGGGPAGQAGPHGGRELRPPPRPCPDAGRPPTRRPRQRRPEPLGA